MIAEAPACPPTIMTDRISSLDETLDRLLDALGEEWAYGVVRLTEFEKLFGKDEHIELLKDVGGAFFGDVQQILWDDLLLRITRLTDQADAGKGKDNLTVHRLQKFCERDELLLKKVKEQVEAADHAAKVARLHRDKRIGHKDLNYALAGIQPQPTTGRGRGPQGTVACPRHAGPEGDQGAAVAPQHAL